MDGDTGATAGEIPLLPQGIVLFESLPMRAVVVDALGPAVQNGAVVARFDEGFGVVIIRDDGVAEAFLREGGRVWHGADALQRLQQLPQAAVSARRFEPQILDVVVAVMTATACYEDLHLEWIDVQRLCDDVRGRSGTHVVELDTPAGRGVAAFRDGTLLIAYTENATGSLSLLDGLSAQSSGSVTVRRLESSAGDSLDTAMVHLFGQAQPVITAHAVAQPHEAALAARRLAALAPELSALARLRLQRSAARVEALVDEALAGGRSVEWLAAAVRGTAVRGVVPSRMHELADEMLALANERSRGQTFLPA